MSSNRKSASKAQPQRRKLKRRKLRSVLIFVLVVGIISGAVALALPKIERVFAGAPDYSGTGTSSVTVEVKEGQTLAQIGNALKSAGVVKSVDSFIAAAQSNQNSSKLQPGVYQLKLNMKSSIALEQMLSNNSGISNKVVIPEGKRATWILNRIATQTKIPLAELQKAADHANTLGLPAYAHGKIEGFLFPATYSFSPNATADDVMSAMIAKYNEQAAALGIEVKAKAVGMTPYQLLTIASLLQVEGHPRDFSKVARVVYNRLAAPMRLEFDSTVNYGLKKTDVILSAKQLSVDTPYNMYLHDGLPPTPIDNPGAEAISAALNPAQGDWLYFITTNLQTQETKFSKDYATFLKNKAEFLSYCSNNPGQC